MTTEQRVTEIRRLIRGWTGRSDERRILQLLTECPPKSLDAVLRQLNLHHLVRNLHNRAGAADNRTRLVQLLTIDMIDHLSLETRVELVWALQRGSTRHSLELGIRNILLHSRGNELRILRNMLNDSGSHRDLPRLIFKDIDDEGIRTEILDHIRNNTGQIDDVIVLSDIDDTVFARLHDRRYPGKTRYPGVLAFFRVLSGDGPITFVTARPGLFGGIVAAWTRRTLAKAGIRRFTILTGSLLALRSHSSMARRKITNIRQYHQVFPEYGLVFVGDSGQGDAEVGRLMRSELPDVVRAVFIHDINETALDQPSDHQESGIAFFDTYIAAAALAWRTGLISHGQALEVGEEAIRELKALTVIPPQMRKDRLQEHMDDLMTLQNTIRP